MVRGSRRTIGRGEEDLEVNVYNRMTRWQKNNKDSNVETLKWLKKGTRHRD